MNRFKSYLSEGIIWKVHDLPGGPGEFTRSIDDGAAPFKLGAELRLVSVRGKACGVRSTTHCARPNVQLRTRRSYSSWSN
jgi:hypothetical protein